MVCPSIQMHFHWLFIHEWCQLTLEKDRFFAFSFEGGQLSLLIALQPAGQQSETKEADM